MSDPATDKLVERLHDWALDLRLPLTNKHVSTLNEAAAAIQRLTERAESAEAERDRLRAALEWYANPEIYKPHPHGPAFDDRDLSFKARAALTGEVK